MILEGVYLFTRLDFLYEEKKFADDPRLVPLVNVGYR